MKTLSVTQNIRPTVECRQGVLSGARMEGVDVFYDIPYAADLGATRRFSLPLAPLAWKGVRDASRPGPVFPQTSSRLTTIMGTTGGFANQSEDAFRLNVFAPSNYMWETHAPKLPVFVWIHGGGWLSGGAPLAWYRADALARSGRAIVVTVNYRLGAFGNLYLPGQTTGSMTVHDLIAALRWIHCNIEAFGADRSRITLCGQSAGAWYTAALAASGEAAGLFAQAILLSLPGSIRPQTPPQAAALAEHYCRLLGVPAELEVLRQLPVQSLLAGQVELARAHAPFADILETFLPLQSATLTADLVAATAARCAHMPILAGTLPEEMGAFFWQDPRVLRASDNDTSRRFESTFGPRGPAVYAARRAERPDADNYVHLLRLVSDERFREPTRRLAEHLAQAGGQCHLYEFTWRSKAPRLGACHCLELPFLFDNFEAWPDAAMLQQLDLGAARRLARSFQRAILNFVERGDPNGEGLPRWPAYTRASVSAMRFDEVLQLGEFDVEGHADVTSW